MLCSVSDCRCPVDTTSGLRKIRYTGIVCQVCWEMFLALYKVEWFKKAQYDYLLEQARIDRMRPGREG